MTWSPDLGGLDTVTRLARIKRIAPTKISFAAGARQKRDVTGHPGRGGCRARCAGIRGASSASSRGERAGDDRQTAPARHAMMRIAASLQVVAEMVVHGFRTLTRLDLDLDTLRLLREVNLSDTVSTPHDDRSVFASADEGHVVR